MSLINIVLDLIGEFGSLVVSLTLAFSLQVFILQEKRVAIGTLGLISGYIMLSTVYMILLALTAATSNLKLSLLIGLVGAATGYAVAMIH